ncbi:MAG: hypothetical protein WBK46_07960 [Ruminococcus flavefaciens]
MKKILFAAVSLLCALTSCEAETYDTFVFPQQESSALEPVDNRFTNNDYSNIPPVSEETIEVFTSEDGICTIQKKNDYYDVSLDLRSGDHFGAGKAYAETLLKADHDFEKKAEQIISDTMIASMVLVKKSKRNDVLLELADKMRSSLPPDYGDEVEGFSSVFSKTDGISLDDGVLSSDEAVIFQLYYDIFLDYNGSAVSVGGNRSETGSQISAVTAVSFCRKNDLLLSDHCVLRLIGDDRTVNSVSYLGMLGVKTAVTDKGVLASIINADREVKYDHPCGIPRSFVIREALEKCDTAEKTGEYLVKEVYDPDYLFSVFLSDRDNVFSAELSSEKGKSVLRDKDTDLFGALPYDCPDCFFNVMSFVSDGETDRITLDKNTLNIRYLTWRKYNDIFSGSDPLNITSVKNILTSETIDSHTNIIRDNKMQFMLIVDHASGTFQADLVREEGVKNMPDFIDLGSF